jgi:hypothetical protein
MPWTYEQPTGRLLTPNANLLAIGYSGLGNGKNNPDLQNHPNLGPLPRGRWHMGAAINHPECGPITIPLTPDPTNQTFARNGFMIHGDLTDHCQDASHGCLILARYARQRLDESPDRIIDCILPTPSPEAP